MLDTKSKAKKTSKRTTKKSSAKKKKATKKKTKTDGFSLKTQTAGLEEGNTEKPLPKKKKAPRKTKKATASNEESVDEIASSPKEASFDKSLNFDDSDDGQTKYMDGELEEISDNLDEFVDPNKLVVELSKSLMRKIIQQSKDEGISVGDFVGELISEGVVLRAWEIVERKGQMRNPQSVPSGNRNNINNSNNRNQRKNHRGGVSHGRYQAIMDDKATFLEYVRNQERNRR